MKKNEKYFFKSIIPNFLNKILLKKKYFILKKISLYVIYKFFNKISEYSYLVFFNLFF